MIFRVLRKWRKHLSCKVDAHSTNASDFENQNSEWPSTNCLGDALTVSLAFSKLTDASETRK